MVETVRIGPSLLLYASHTGTPYGFWEFFASLTFLHELAFRLVHVFDSSSCSMHWNLRILRPDVIHYVKDYLYLFGTSPTSLFDEQPRMVDVICTREDGEHQERSVANVFEFATACGVIRLNTKLKSH